MSETRPPSRPNRQLPQRYAFAVVGVALAASLWAGWNGHLTPSICNVGASDLPQNLPELFALVHAHWSEDDCGHEAECRFKIWPAEGDGRIAIDVEHARIDLWGRQCRWATDNETRHEYSARGAPLHGAAASAPAGG